MEYHLSPYFLGLYLFLLWQMVREQQYQTTGRIKRNGSYHINDGEYTIKADYTQTELKNAIAAGEFVFHKVGSEVKVLSDINSFVSITKEMNEEKAKIDAGEN